MANVKIRLTQFIIYNNNNNNDNTKIYNARIYTH